MARTGALEEDVLVNVEKIHSIFTNGIFHYITYFMCLVIVVSIGSSFLVLLTTYNVVFWQQYSPVILGGGTVVLSYVTFVAGKKKFMHIYNDVLPKLKSYRVLDEKRLKVVQFQAKLAEFWVVASVVTIMLTVIAGQPFYGDEYDILLPVKLCVDYLGKFAYVGEFIFFKHFFYGGFLMVADGATLLYIAMHIKFQLYILNTELDKMNKDFRNKNFVQNEKFQNKICKKLIDCVKHHQLIIELNEKLNDLIRYPVLGFTTAGILTLVSITFVLFSGVDIPRNPAGNIRGALIGAFALQLTGVFVYSGQALLNESEQTFEAIRNLPWYNYNARNRMLLVVFMHKTQTPLDLSSSGVVTIQYSLIIRLIRSVYSLFTFLSNVKQ